MNESEEWLGCKMKEEDNRSKYDEKFIWTHKNNEPSHRNIDYHKIKITENGLIENLNVIFILIFFALFFFTLCNKCFVVCIYYMLIFLSFLGLYVCSFYHTNFVCFLIYLLLKCSARVLQSTFICLCECFAEAFISI